MKGSFSTAVAIVESPVERHEARGACRRVHTFPIKDYSPELVFKLRQSLLRGGRIGRAAEVFRGSLQEQSATIVYRVRGRVGERAHDH